MPSTDKPNKLLLHACCGPCLMWPLKELKEAGVDVSLLFYNPNIHPNVEWERRLDNTVKVARHYDVPLIVRGCSLAEEWLQRADQGKERCRFCYEIRMTCVAEEALKGGFDAVSSSLLVSPYQDRDLILKEGEKAVEGRGLTFVPYDWREGFRKGQKMARDLGLYRQKYCGCLVSLEKSDFREAIQRDHEKLALSQCLQTEDFESKLLGLAADGLRLALDSPCP